MPWIATGMSRKARRKPPRPDETRERKSNSAVTWSNKAGATCGNVMASAWLSIRPLTNRRNRPVDPVFGALTFGRVSESR